MAYNIKKITVIFTNLPFTPCIDEVIYMSDRYDNVADGYIRENTATIRNNLRNKFKYLPFIYNDIDKSIKYCAPYATNTGNTDRIGSDALFDYLSDPDCRSRLSPCLLRYNYNESDIDNRIHYFNGYTFTTDGPDDAEPLFAELCNLFNTTPNHILRDKSSIFFSCLEDVIKKPEPEPQTEEEKNEQAIKRLTEEIREKISELCQYGVSEWALQQLISPKLRLSRLVITPDMRIVLPDYNNMEIVMEPLVMAVYMLFLHHPEGIVFKTLPDYRQELTDIYIDVIRRRGDHNPTLSPRRISAIDKVTDPLNNSINEKCARIKHAFLMRFSDSMAAHYYITGQRSELKRISLSRELVSFQADVAAR